MKLKGDLDSIGLAELFQTLSDQRATGVLTVSSGTGEKLIAIAHGEIAVLSDKVAERVRLGDLLVARGKLTESQLSEALKVQRTSDQRSKLGDVLVKLNMIKPLDITESLRFQLEEEIYDLFTWKAATFEFDGDQSVDDAASKESQDTNLQRVNLDPQTLIAEASRRMEDWKVIENRLPTPYLCFKLSPKGEELSSKATQATANIIKLLKEGRTIETTVKRSCMGRFNVCKIIVKLLDDGWIFPYPASELKFLASEHRAAGRYSDALYVYRRMLEASQTEAESMELQGLIDDTLDAIRRAQESGASVEGAETISYKEAAERYKRRQNRTRMAVLVCSGVGLIAATFFLTQSLRPPKGINEDYQQAYQDASEAQRKQQYQKAVSIWREFQRKISRSSPTYELIEEQITALLVQDDAYLREYMARIKTLAANNPTEADAEYQKLLKELVEKLPDSPYIATINDELEQLKLRRQKEENARRAEQVKGLVTQAQDLLKQRKYTAARKLCAEIANTAPAGSTEDQQTQKILKELSAIEERSAQAIKKAEEALAANKAEQAITLYDSAGNEWPELLTAENGRREASRLKRRADDLQQIISTGRSFAERRSYIEALERMETAARDYPEFEATAAARAKIVELKETIVGIDSRIAEAQAAVKRGDKAGARKLYSDLLKEYSSHLATRKVDIPVAVNSTPSGARILMDGVDAGVTPADILIKVDKPVDLRIELAGYAPKERRLERLGFESLEIRETLEREAHNIITFKEPIYAPPRVIGKSLYVLHGSTMTVMSPQDHSIQWTLEKLLDASADTRPNPAGTGAPVFVTDKSWWYPRWPPMPRSETSLLLPLRSRDILEINTAAKSVRTLITLPAEPVGWPYLERRSQIAGKALLAVACTDGKIRAYDVEKMSSTLWEKAIDTAPPTEVTFATGLCARSGGGFVALSTKGKLAGYNINIAEKPESWSRDLAQPLAEHNSLPESPDEELAALVLRNGKVVVVDLDARGATQWELNVAQPMDEVTHALVAKDGIYVATRRGDICKYSREKASGRPTLIWKRALNGPCDLPLHAGKSLYAISQFGTTYAISPADGQIRWMYKVPGTPTILSDSGEVLYIATQEGKLLVLKAD